MLYLVRHGRAAAGVEDRDPGLDELGHVQARAAAQALLQIRRPPARRLAPPTHARNRRTDRRRCSASLPEIRDEVAEVFDPELAVAERRTMLGPLLSGLWSEQSDELRRFRDRVAFDAHHLRPEPMSRRSWSPTSSPSRRRSAPRSMNDRVSPVAVPNASITRLELRNGSLSLIEAGGVAHLSDDQVTHAHSGSRRPPAGDFAGPRKSAPARPLA